MENRHPARLAAVCLAAVMLIPPSGCGRQSRGEALCDAAADGDAARVLSLIERGVDVNYRTRANGFSALHWACLSCRTNSVEMLLEHGADPNAIDRTGHVPLDLAMGDELCNVALVHLLLEHGADPKVAANYLDAEGIHPQIRTLIRQRSEPR